MSSMLPNNVISREDKEVKFESELAQIREGDCLPSGFQSNLPDRLHLKIKPHDVTDLLRLWNSWNDEMKGKFNAKYGDIALLLSVKVDEQLIQAMLWFWDPSYKCFTFNKNDMVPTLEEYSAFLRLPHLGCDMVYHHGIESGYRKKLAYLMGVSRQTVNANLKGNEESEGISYGFLRKFMNQHAEEEHIRDIFALVVYGLVIFSRASPTIDMAVVAFIDQIGSGMNPVPAFLAETFRTLSYCRQNKGYFRGCAPLLCVWMKSHLRMIEGRFHQSYWAASIPLTEIKEIKFEDKGYEAEWINYFKRWTPERVIWRAPWMNFKPTIYVCGKYPWVPLIGLWGLTGYAPNMVRRQFESSQFVPRTVGLSTIDFVYGNDNTRRKVEKFLQAWEAPLRIRSGNFMLELSPEYEVWQLRRGKNIVVPMREAPMTQLPPPNPMVELEIAKRKLVVEKEELERNHKKVKRELFEELEKRDQRIQKLKESKADWKKSFARSIEDHESTIDELNTVKNENLELRQEVQDGRTKRRQMFDFMLENVAAASGVAEAMEKKIDKIKRGMPSDGDHARRLTIFLEDARKQYRGVMDHYASFFLEDE